MGGFSLRVDAASPERILSITAAGQRPNRSGISARWDCIELRRAHVGKWRAPLRICAGCWWACGGDGAMLSIVVGRWRRYAHSWRHVKLFVVGKWRPWVQQIEH